MRVVFFGTPAFAVPTLEALLSSAHEVVAVVTQPDRPRDRGHRTSASAVKRAAGRTPVLQPVSATAPEFARQFADLRADIGVVAAYGQILSQDILNTPRLGMINVHASLLPRYRGAAPINRAVINGDTETGVTIMRMVRALDAGPMLSRRVVSIGPEQTSDELERELATIGAALLIDTIDGVGSLVETPQDAASATYAPKLTRADGVIDWNWPATRIHNSIRGLHPWPHVRVLANGTPLILHRSRPSADRSEQPPGTVVDASGDRIRVATGDGMLDLVQLQPANGRPMSARDFLAGRPLAPGTVLVPSA